MRVLNDYMLEYDPGRIILFVPCKGAPHQSGHIRIETIGQDSPANRPRFGPFAIERVIFCFLKCLGRKQSKKANTCKKQYSQDDFFSMIVFNMLSNFNIMNKDKNFGSKTFGME